MVGMLTVKGIDEALENLPQSNRASLRHTLLMAIREVYQHDDDLTRIESIPSESLIMRVWNVKDDPKQIKAKRKNLSSLKSSLNQSFKKLSNEGKNPEGVKIGRENTFVISDDRKDKLIQRLGTNIQENESLHNMVKAFRQALSQVNPDIASGDYEAALEELDKTKEMLKMFSKHMSIGDQAHDTAEEKGLFGKEEEVECLISSNQASYGGGGADTYQDVGDGTDVREAEQPELIEAAAETKSDELYEEISEMDEPDDGEDIEGIEEVEDDTDVLEFADVVDEADEVIEEYPESVDLVEEVKPIDGSEDIELVEDAEEGEIDDLQEMKVIDERDDLGESEETNGFDGEVDEELECVEDIVDAEEEVSEEVEIVEESEEKNDFEEMEEIVEPYDEIPEMNELDDNEQIEEVEEDTEVLEIADELDDPKEEDESDEEDLESLIPVEEMDAASELEDLEGIEEVEEETDLLKVAEELNNRDDTDEVVEKASESVDITEEMDAAVRIKDVEEIDEAEEGEEENAEELEFTEDVMEVEGEIPEEVETVEEGEETNDYEEIEEIRAIDDIKEEEETEIHGVTEIDGFEDNENINATGDADQGEGAGKGEGTGREEKNFGYELATDDLSALKQILRKLNENVESRNYRTVMDELDQLKRMINDVANPGGNRTEEKNAFDPVEETEEVEKEDIETVQLADAIEEYEELEEIEDVEEIEEVDEDIEALEIGDERDDVNEVEEAEEVDEADTEEVELAEDIEEVEEEDAEEVEPDEEEEEIDDPEEMDEFEEIEAAEVLEDEMSVGNMEKEKEEGGGSGEGPGTEDLAALGQMLREIDANIESEDYQKVLDELEQLKKMVNDVLSRIRNREQEVITEEEKSLNADEERPVKDVDEGDIKEIESDEELEELYKPEQIEEVEEIDKGEICEDQVLTHGIEGGEGTTGTGNFNFESETERLLNESIREHSPVSNEKENPDSREFLSEDNQKEEVSDPKFLAERFEEYLDITKRFYNRHIRIPGGNYVIGVKDPSQKEHAQRRVTLRSFYLGEYPVTNSLFRVFADKTGYKTSAERVGYGEVYEAQIKKIRDHESGRESYVLSMGIMSKIVDGACWRYPFGPGSSIEGKENHPVVQISIDDAKAFAAWTGKRLPSEAEWEAAARGMDAMIYPWGNEWRGNNSNLESSYVGDTTPVDHYQDLSRSPFGIFDMVGNVFEWTTTLYANEGENKTSDETYYTIKGGSFIDCEIMSASWRVKASEKSWSNIIGFRCAV
ncbi:MAG: SUMF1/EgtB/PvdO family nonheme iron enzyme [Thermodesulfobacteriota bacterium]|nr:SUMF1/EgtB/PvdO family nonheme iron enzyme [Thermodesulfobacteriota bacterium]